MKIYHCTNNTTSLILTKPPALNLDLNPKPEPSPYSDKQKRQAPTLRQSIMADLQQREILALNLTNLNSCNCMKRHNKLITEK